MSTIEVDRAAFLEGQIEPQPRRRRPKRKTVNTVIWFVVLLALTAIILYPLVWLVFSTFKPSSEFGQNPGLIPENPTIDNYLKVFDGIAGTPLWRFFGNSLLIAVSAVIGILASSALAAYAFARIKFKGVGVLFAAMIGTLLLPFHVIIIPQYIMFQKLELVDTYVPLILPKFLATEAFFVFLMVQFIRNIPRDMDEAARIDGAGHTRIFFSIILPLSRPILGVVSIFAVTAVWKDFLWPKLVMPSPETRTVSVGIYAFAGGTPMNVVIAASVIAAIPTVIIFLIFQRNIMSGLTTGSIKG